MDTTPLEIPGPLPGNSAFDGFPPSPSMMPGVASLESSVVQQTKTEIRSLAAEIAELASRPLDPADFYEGFLPRLCTAMGASAASVWRLAPTAGPEGLACQLEASHRTPDALLQAGEPTDPHRRILQCVASEGEPVLVPPRNVRVATQRPANPLDDALLIVPVRIEESVEMLLEIVQRPSGGPAAQRGYLRFAVQMAELMADSLRRHRLRRQRSYEQQFDELQHRLLDIASASNQKQRCAIAVEALHSLLAADRVLLLEVGRRIRVTGISGCPNWDSRSETVVNARALVHALIATEEPSTASSPSWLHATDRRTSDEPATSILQTKVDALCASLAARKLLHLPLGSEARVWALVAYGANGELPAEFTDDGDGYIERLGAAVGGLLLPSPTWVRAWENWLPLPLSKTESTRLNGWQRTQRWIARIACAALACVVALFPVPQQINAVATLQPRSRQAYYAPANGIVTAVQVDEGLAVKESQPLLQITSHELETQVATLKIDLETTLVDIDEKRGLLNRGENLSPLEKDHLEFQLRELHSVQDSLTQRLAEMETRMQRLLLHARESGTVATWDLKNRLLHHPVQEGDLLVTTYDPDGVWELEIAVPEYRAGLVATAMKNSREGMVPVHFSLASHPDQLQWARCVKLAAQVIDGPAASYSAQPSRVLMTTATIDQPQNLPLRKDGAVSRATLECGSVPLLWLVFRDAYWSVSSRLRMFW